jgi:hypothetical protein
MATASTTALLFNFAEPVRLQAQWTICVSFQIAIGRSITAELPANLLGIVGSVGSALDGGTGPAMSLEQQIDRLQAQRLQRPFLLKG